MSSLTKGKKRKVSEERYHYQLVLTPEQKKILDGLKTQLRGTTYKGVLLKGLKLLCVVVDVLNRNGKLAVIGEDGQIVKVYEVIL